MTLVKFDSSSALVEKVIKELTYLSHQEGEAFHVALSGGSTPKQIFTLLANPQFSAEVNWKKLHFWWGDERCVAADDLESNYGEAKRLLFDMLPNLPEENIHPVQGTLDPTQASIHYTSEMKKQLPVKDGWPQFDWIWLGMGDDGHTASLFVDGVPLSYDCWTAVAQHPKTGQKRITLSMGVLNAAKRVTFLVTGESKAKMLEMVLKRDERSMAYPAAHVSPKSEKLEWYVDQAASTLISPE